MKLLQYQLPNNSLKLLDDYLSSIASSEDNGTDTGNDADTKNSDSNQQEQDNITAAIPTSLSSQQSPTAQQSAHEEQLHNSVLRVAAELFGNNISLLENSLALLEEQERYQHNDNNDNNNSSSSKIIPPIRIIRAKRSGRVAILVRKQQKKSRASINQNNHPNDKQIIDDYYLCLLGRDRVTIDHNNAFKTSRGTYLCNPHHRVGMNCTCRSFFHNIKGSGGSSGGGRFKRNGDRSPPKKASSYNSGNNNNIVCKHLLAVILMPHLLPWRSQSVEEEVVDDKLFTKLVMRASIG